LYRTGDLGLLDTDGYLVVVGRKKDLVIRGGEKIPIGHVEAVLRQHPSVADVVIVGLADRRLGERCVAVIEIRPGQEVSLEIVSRFLDDNGVTKAFWPEIVAEVDHLPRNEVGKVRRVDVEELVKARIKEG
jgi:non-ribosomal peptide synthetase component E (peptide arylation enzyme)